MRGYDWSEQLSKDKVYALFKTLHHTFERRLTFDNSFDQIVLERLVSIEVSKTGVSNNEKKRFVEDITKECNNNKCLFPSKRGWLTQRFKERKG